MRGVPARLLPGSERVRLTALYGALLLLAGGGLVALVYVLVSQGMLGSLTTAVRTTTPGTMKGLELDLRDAVPAQKLPPGTLTEEQLESFRVTQNISAAVTDAALHRLLVYSLIALAVFAVLSILLAWWMAGRVLRPVAVITETARRLSGENLHERIALDAPPGELKRLADTFDGMLGRMEQLVAAQRRFAANAAHELRTPLAVQRAAAEIGLAGEPDAERVARIRARLLAVCDESEAMIEGLLLLAAAEEGPGAAAGAGPDAGGRPGEGLSAAEPVALHETAAAELAGCAEEAAGRGLTVHAALGPLVVRGDPALLGHLVRNLLANAVRHNHDGGTVTVTTGARELTVTNTGPVVPPGEVPRLLEPFRRREARRHAPGEGAGLGLSIVGAIARAHSAELTATANPAPGGGLTVRLRFPGATGA
ncbi:ATP-binding protein [Streptomyces sp. NPDC101132]|uniref:ATP-binding protein n=1 Tax=Streptomyces sp. NPDC101132 TaxID=3366110 RepID=UPI00382F7B14